MSYTPDQLESTLDQFDENVKTGILDGTIKKVMAEIGAELVSKLNNLQRGYLILIFYFILFREIFSMFSRRRPAVCWMFFPNRDF
jgi:hypothetical protein